MSLRAVGFWSLLLASACGGSSFQGSESGQGGASSSGKAGSASSGGSSSAGGTSPCATARCAAPACTQGTLVTAAGECCPTCSCELIDCAYPVCSDGATPVVQPGDCCPSCPVPVTACKGVECQPPSPCADGYVYERPAGACCSGCVPASGPIPCLKIFCAEPQCPTGYVPGDQAGACCYDCVPDPNYCVADRDCIIADRPRPCCGCPEAISNRLYEEDACWSTAASPRPIPKQCYPDFTCDALCGPCAEPGAAKCVEGRCTEVR